MSVPLRDSGEHQSKVICRAIFNRRSQTFVANVLDVDKEPVFFGIRASRKSQCPTGFDVCIQIFLAYSYRSLKPVARKFSRAN